MGKDDPDYVVDESQNGEPEIGSQRKPTKPKLNYDDILEHIGQLGRYANLAYLHGQIFILQPV